MSAEHATPHPTSDIENESQGAVDHGDGHGDDDHGHESETLGPVDVLAWGAFVLGTGLGVAAALCIAVATGGLPG